MEKVVTNVLRVLEIFVIYKLPYRTMPLLGKNRSY